jgi:hypothetical protein
METDGGEKNEQAAFRCQKILPKFSDSSSHRIFTRMYEALNIDKK